MRCEACQKTLKRRANESPSDFGRRRFCNTQCSNAVRRNPSPVAGEIKPRMERFLELMGLTSIPAIPDGRGDGQRRIRRARV